MNRDEAIALLRGPLGEVIRDTTTKFVVPLVWETCDDEGGVVLRNGTMFFLDAGEGVFAVTAGHVYQGYLEAKDKYPQTFCQLWNMRFDPVARLIACQSDPIAEPDIATFRVTPEEVSRLGKMPITGSQRTWPPAPPEEGKGVFFAGFPGGGRLQVGPDEIEFAVFQGLLVA